MGSIISKTFNPSLTTIKHLDFKNLKNKTERQLWTADDSDKERLEGIIGAVDSLRREYDLYQRTYTTGHTLNEIENQLLSLIK